MPNYIVVDLEMCKVPRHMKTEEFRIKHEIIQIGAVKLNEEYEEVSRFSTYVHPQFGSIDGFISNLTGISRNNVKEAPTIETAINEFLNWIGTEESICVSWSMTDKYQFIKEMEGKGIENERMNLFFETWVDCQQVFTEVVDTGRIWSLEEAIYASGINQEGNMHDGLMDSVNTASLYRKLMTEEDFKMVEAYENGRHKDIDHLSYNLGDLLREINFA